MFTVIMITSVIERNKSSLVMMMSNQYKNEEDDKFLSFTKMGRDSQKTSGPHGLICHLQIRKSGSPLEFQFSNKASEFFFFLTLNKAFRNYILEK